MLENLKRHFGDVLLSKNCIETRHCEISISIGWIVWHIPVRFL